MSSGHPSRVPPFPGVPGLDDVEEARAPVEASACDARALFDSHLDFVWRNLRRLGVPESQIEDASQDVFLVVHRRGDSYSSSLSSVESWLFGILLRVAHAYHRTQRRRLGWLVPVATSAAWDETPSLADGPAEILAQRESAALFECALAELDESKRAVFLLADVEQLPVPQVAAALGINLNTAYWRLRKARLAFRRALERLRAREENLAREGRP